MNNKKWKEIPKYGKIYFLGLKKIEKWNDYKK
jgi:hypothetical protein